jgi:hypothetical protein
MSENFLVKAVQHYVDDLSQGDNVYADFLLLESGWQVPETGGCLGEVKFQGQIWPVVWCDIELTLRKEILDTPDNKAVLLFPDVDNQDQLVPPDIRARSHRRALHPIGLRYILAAKTGVKWPPEVDQSEYKPSIQRHWDTLISQASRELLGVTRDRLDNLIIRSAFGFQIKDDKAPQIVVKLYQSDFAEKPFDRELDILKGQLNLYEVNHRQIINWLAMEPGRARDFLVNGAMMRIEQQSGLNPSWGRLQTLLGKLLQSKSQPDAICEVIDLARRSWEEMPVNDRRRLMKEVEEKLESYQTVDLEVYNDMSPKALRHRILEESERLAKGERRKDHLEELGEHLFSNDERRSIETLQKMDEVLAWRDQVKAESALTKSAMEWTNWYRQEASFGDWAALQLASTAVSKLNKQVGVVTDLYWDDRDEVNAGFASAFLDQYEKTIYHPDTTGVHKILDKLVLPVLETRRRVLLIILDGLNYPGLLQIVDQLNQEQPNPIGVQSSFAGASILPSITSASRKAIFLGERPTDTLDSEEIYAEKAKTSERVALEKACKKFQVVLHNRTTLSEPGGKVNLFTHVANSDISLVVLILNEVDEDLKGGIEPRLLSLDDLGIFREALADGLKNGRQVFLVSDHGHTWHRSKDRRRGDQAPGGSHRHLPLSEGEIPPKNALVTSDPEILPPGTDRIAFLYRVGDYFGRQPMRGYHGGASLEEVVIPCVELAFGADPLVPGKIPEEVVDIEGREECISPTQGIVLTLQDGNRIRLELTDLNTKETQALQLLASFGRVNEQQLRQHLNTRRVAGVMSTLMEKLGEAGLDLVETGPMGGGGTEYIFRPPQ